MKKFTSLFTAALFLSGTALTFAGNKCEVIIPGNHAPMHFKLAANVHEGDYLPTTVIFKVKPQYRQNCKINSVDNILPLQDYLNSVGATKVAKIYPHVEAPAQERNALGQKLVDLSLIYSFKFTSGLNLEKVINGMLSLGYFEYVEPWYVPKLHAVCTPNDPSLGSQYHIQGNVTGSIDVKGTAWCTTNGSASFIVGITDTGTELTHPDLAANVYHNTADPVDGSDNDADGYIDDYNGWDVGMNDNDPTWQGNNHGVMTSGDACAVTNNSTGVSSPGFNTKFIMCKIADASGALVAAYQGIQWLADFSAKHGNIVQMISNSWGGSGGGSYGQNIIDYAAINNNILVMASAGNNGVEDQTYPSSYNNIYRVSASTSTDNMAGFSSYGLDVDYCAPGNNVYSTTSGAGYQSASGTSMACPVSAGGAALIQSVKNYTNAFQIGEQMKQTCDPMPSATQYPLGKLGKGRIDINNALTQAAKSILVNPVTVTDNNDNIFDVGETIDISGIFTNYLDPSSSSATATLSTYSVSAGPNPTITNGSFTIGALATLATTNNNASPFTAVLSASAPINQTVRFKIHITDGTFTGDTYFDILVNPDYINITINDLHTTITSKGRIGYNNDGQVNGLGVEYENPSPQALLYESSLMIGASSTKVSDMFRDASTGNTDFGSTVRVKQVLPATVSDFDVDGSFNDAPATTSGPIPVSVHHNAYAWQTAPYRKFVIVKYVITNTGASTLSGLYAGIMSDWDVPNANSGQDKASWDVPNKMGYVYWVGNNLYAATKVLTNSAPPNCHVVDNVSGGNGDIDPTTNFTTADKYKALSVLRASDGFSATGGDVMNCVSSGPFTVNAGDSVTVAFALIGGDNLADIQATACAAQDKWDNSCSTGVFENGETDNFWAYAYPSPATTNVNIAYNVIGYEHAAIRIMNSLGEVVMTYENIQQGRNTLTLDASKLSAGNYFFQLKAGEAVLTKRFSVMK
ncbi:MAG: S8 family peptidase [Bacteroidetes bacterium]|nr:S8 family peptidase [Bacteroidota bacterium]